MDAFDPNEFWVSGPLIAIVLTDGVTERGGFRTGALLKLGYKKGDGTEGSLIPLFTDPDLAERFLQSLGEEGDRYHAVQPNTRAVLARLLEDVQRHGTTEVGFDPAPGHDRRAPIARVIAALRDRQ